MDTAASESTEDATKTATLAETGQKEGHSLWRAKREKKSKTSSNPCALCEEVPRGRAASCARRRRAKPATIPASRGRSLEDKLVGSTKARQRNEHSGTLFSLPLSNNNYEWPLNSIAEVFVKTQTGCHVKVRCPQLVAPSSLNDLSTGSALEGSRFSFFFFFFSRLACTSRPRSPLWHRQVPLVWLECPVGPVRTLWQRVQAQPEGAHSKRGAWQKKEQGGTTSPRGIRAAQ